MSTATPTNVAPTAAGYRLAAKLAPAIGSTEQIARTCSLIARSAATYARIQEMRCNVEMDDRTTARMEEREAGLERRIRELVQDLPATDDGPFTVTFGGDPRGYCVKITAPGESGRILRGKDWGGVVGVA